jgi:hypothetical protein
MRPSEAAVERARAVATAPVAQHGCTPARGPQGGLARALRSSGGDSSVHSGGGGGTSPPAACQQPVPVAVKVLKADRQGRGIDCYRLIREAQVLTRLSHK